MKSTPEFLLVGLLLGLISIGLFVLGSNFEKLYIHIVGVLVGALALVCCVISVAFEFPGRTESKRNQRQ